VNCSVLLVIFAEEWLYFIRKQWYYFQYQ